MVSHMSHVVIGEVGSLSLMVSLHRSSRGSLINTSLINLVSETVSVRWTSTLAVFSLQVHACHSAVSPKATNGSSCED
jgi:hypothetical protein